MERAPDYVEAIVGFRTWLMCGDGELRSIMTPTPWSHDEAMVAECALKEAFGKDNVTEHEAPHVDCSCGIHSFRSIPQSWTSWATDEAAFERRLGRMEDFNERFPHMAGIRDLVPGISLSWGSIKRGDNGFRAQYCFPGALAFSPFWDETKIKRIVRFAKRYGIDAVSMLRLEERAAQIP